MMSLYEAVAKRIQEPYRQRTLEALDSEILRAYCQSKRGSHVHDDPLDGLRYNVLGAAFAEFLYLNNRHHIILYCSPSDLQRLLKSYQGVEMAGEHRWWAHNNVDMVSIKIGSDIPNEAILSLVDQSYNFAVTRLKSERQALIELLDRQPVSHDKISALIEIYGLKHRLNEILGLLQPAISIQRCKRIVDWTPEKSKTGGMPFLPSGVEWPRFKNKALQFLYQINLEEIPECPAKEDLPSKGMLYFFSAFAWGESGDGIDLADWENTDNSRVIFFDGAIADLKHHRLPPELGLAFDTRVYETYALKFECIWTLPRAPRGTYEPDPVLVDRGWTDEEFDQLEDLYFAICDLYFDTGIGGSQLLGYLSPVQTTPLKVGERLLLETSANDETTLYFIILSKDLSARSFERVRAEIQFT